MHGSLGNLQHCDRIGREGPSSAAEAGQGGDGALGDGTRRVSATAM